MKHLKRYFLFIPVLLLFSALTSCIKNHCSGVVCKSGGVCVNDICACPSGYEGAHCEAAWSSKFTGSWHATDSYIRDTTHHHYDVSVSALNADSLLVQNFSSAIDIHGRPVDTVTGLFYSFSAELKVIASRASRWQFSFNTAQVLDSVNNVYLQNWYGTMDSTNNTISGTYTVRIRDSSVTAKFSWTR